jgi:hypothetical protein
LRNGFVKIGEVVSWAAGVGEDVLETSIGWTGSLPTAGAFK